MKHVTAILLVICAVILLQSNVFAADIIEEVDSIEQIPLSNNEQVQPKTKKAKKAKKIKKQALKQAAEAVAVGTVISVGNQILNQPSRAPREVITIETKTEGVSDTRSQYRRKLTD